MSDGSDTQAKPNWLVFTEEMKADWETSTADYLNSYLGTEGIAVGIALPKETDVMKEGVLMNETLKGTITLSKGDAKVEIPVVLPYYGVFFIKSNDQSTPLTEVWNSWLGEAIGVRSVIPTSHAKREKCYNTNNSINLNAEELEWRIGLPGGNFLNLKKLAKNAEKASAKKQGISESIGRIICGLPEYPQWLKDAVSQDSATWKTVYAECEANKQNASCPDADDLEHRVLMTFPVWLKYRLAEKIRETLYVQKSKNKKNKDKEDKAESAADQLAKLQEALNGDADALLEVLKGDKMQLGNRLVPVSPNPHRGDTDDVSGLVYVEPKNALDLATRITRVKRINMDRRAMEEIPEEFRQNHSSFEGRLCPVESPESEMVGLSLQLAQGATVDCDGKIQPSADDYLAKLGYGAGLIPFFPHNDGARNMMGAKNLRQALPIVGREAPMVQTGGEKRLNDYIAPLSRLGIYPDSTCGDGQLALGKDLLVAYLPWKGWNMEDAVVVSDSILKDFALAGLPHSYCKYQRRGTCLDEEQNMENGLVKPGTVLNRGDVIARMKREDKHFPIIYEGDTPAKVINISFKDPQNAFEQGVLEYTLEEQIPLKVGDKLMGRHGNKGVIGKIVPENEMPMLPDGRHIQVLLNPHGVISRMNIGQLLETHIGWLLHKGVKTEELLKNGDNGQPIAYPQVDALNMEKIQQELEKTGLDKNGRVQLILPDGNKTVSPVLVGYEHIVRLAHIPMKKIQARGTGKYNPLTGQAVHGRRQGGGQRVGEMEVWALDAYRANSILQEMLGEKSSPLKLNELTGDNKVFSGFWGVLKNWLRALLIECTLKEDGKLQLSRLNSDAFKKECNEAAKVTSDDTIVFGTCADYTCRKCGEAPYGNWLRSIDQKSQSTKLGDNPSLRFGYLLKRAKLRIASPSDLNPSKGDDNEWTFNLAFQIDDTQIILNYSCVLTVKPTTVLLELKGNGSEQWPPLYQSLKTIWCRGTGEKIAKEMSKTTLNAESLGMLNVVCPEHHSVPLKPVKDTAQAPTTIAVDHGLFDEKIFGDFHSKEWKKNSEERWGYIELPEPPDGKSYPEPLKGNSAQGGTYIIPVLPIHMRQPRVKGNSVELDDLDEYGYLPLIRACKDYQKAVDKKESADELGEKFDAICKCLRNNDSKKNGERPGLFQLLEERLQGKNGLIRHEGLGRRVDYSARMVIAPNPDLNWEEVRLSTPVLWELMGEKIIEEFDNCDNPLKLDKVELKRLDDLKEEINGFRSSKRTKEKLDLPFKLIDWYLKKHPETLVLLNRQPSLHRYSFHALKPIPVSPEEAEKEHLGEVIQLSPLVCNDFAADFDGDEMVLHFPLSKEAQDDAQKLRFCNNLRSMATGAPTAHYTQDFKMGTFWLLKRPAKIEDLCKQFDDLLEKYQLTLPEETDPKKKGEQLLDDSISKLEGEKAATFVSYWMRLALDACTRIGVSFGFFDFVQMDKPDIQSLINAATFKELQKQLGDVNETLQKDIRTTVGEDWNAVGLHVNGMVASGARGKKDQLRQILLARGFLGAGNQCEGNPKDPELLRRFVFERSLKEGLDYKDMFYAAMNARKSMCDKKLGTGKAGAITRRLVFALWPYVIAKNGEEYVVRLSLTNEELCNANEIFTEPDGDIWKMIQDEMKENGDFPIGLVAAQSIGERGTQLSMQSFHTGTGATDIKGVNALLANKDNKKKEEFVGETKEKNGFRNSPAYKDIRSCFFRLLWRVMNNASLDYAIEQNYQNAPLMGIGYQKQLRRLYELVDNNVEISLDSPVAKVLFNRFDV